MQKALRIDRIARLQFTLNTSWLYDVFKTQWFMQKDQIFLWIPVFIAVGIGIYFYLPLEPPLIILLMPWVMSVILTVSLPQKYKKAGWIIALICTGMLAGGIRTTQLNAPMLNKKTGPIELEATIETIEKLEQKKGSRLILSKIQTQSLNAQDIPRKIRLQLRADQNIAIGQRIQVLASLNPPSAPVIPGGFDFRRHLYFQGIGAVGFIYRAPVIIEPAPNSWLNIQKTRHLIAQNIRENMTERYAAIVSALIVGQKRAISNEDQQALRDAGLAHMLAISGLHIGLVSGALFFIFRMLMASIPVLALNYPIKKIAAILALMGAMLYMLLAGATVPTQRAVLMSAIVFIAIILDRSPISLRLVACAAMVVLLIKPESLLSASFHMSFAAVTCLIYCYDVTRNSWLAYYTQANILKKIMLYFIAICFTTVIASIATAPFALYHFGQVSFMGSFANLIAMPIFTFFIMPFALLGTLLMGIGLEFLPLQIVEIGIIAMLDIAYWAQSLPGASIQIPAWNFISFILLVVGVLWAMIWKGYGKLVAIIPIVVSIILNTSNKTPDILIASSHKLVAFKTSEKLYVNTKNSEKFILENWQKHHGLTIENTMILPHKGSDKNTNKAIAQCGEEGCRIKLKNNKISFIRSPYATQKECDWADILIALHPVNKQVCNTAIIIDKFDTWKNGAHALWLHNSELKIETIAGNSAGRPWSAYANKKQQRD